MIPEEQAKEIKKQIIQQIESTFQEDKKSQAKEQIESMGTEQVEKFLEKNKLMVSRSSENKGTQECIFCSIISEKIHSYKVDENKNASAILEINPISTAHVLIIPKKHSSFKEKIPKDISSLSEKISKKIKKEFSPKEILTSKTSLFGHDVINLVPVYKNETLDSERRQAKKEELGELQKILTKKKKEKIKPSKPKKMDEKKLWLPKRIP